MLNFPLCGKVGMLRDQRVEATSSEDRMMPVSPVHFSAVACPRQRFCFVFFCFACYPGQCCCLGTRMLNARFSVLTDKHLKHLLLPQLGEAISAVFAVPGMKSDQIYAFKQVGTDERGEAWVGNRGFRLALWPQHRSAHFTNGNDRDK